ncbi:MAG: hypothetical protein JWR47_1844 [Phenylobacterium sp.]|nr:hypothetical protein [Phenylobacterium sp.]
MLKKVLVGLGTLLVTAVIPTVFGMIDQKLAHPVGWAIIALSAPLGLLCLSAALVPEHSQNALSALMAGKPLRPRKPWIELKDAPFIVPGVPGLKGRSSFTARDFLDDCLAGGFVNIPPRYPGAKRNLSRPLLRDKAGHDFVACQVDWEHLRFSWTWAFEVQGEWRSAGFALHPWELGTATHQLNMIDVDVWDQLLSKAKFVWSLMLEPIEELVANSSLIVWARYGSAFQAFRRVPADAWRHFEIVDWERGIAKSVGGEILYSVHVSTQGKAGA